MVLPGVSSLSALTAVPPMVLDLYIPYCLVSELWFICVSIIKGVRDAHSPMGTCGLEGLAATPGPGPGFSDTGVSWELVLSLLTLSPVCLFNYSLLARMPVMVTKWISLTSEPIRKKRNNSK